MCGIIGVTGAPDALTILLDGLARLEYRGYDSAGVALGGEEGLWRRRCASGNQGIEALRKLTVDAPAASAGIGHTRWATHGHPTEANAHPHVDCTGSLAVVHNGIFENAARQRTRLERAGHRFASETDSEVLAHLIEEALGADVRRDGGLADAVRGALAQLTGSFAVVAMASWDPGTLVAARRLSPLVVGLGDGAGAASPAGLVASDIPALVGLTREFTVLEDEQLAVVRPGSIAVAGLDGSPAAPRLLTVDWDLDVARKGGYADFMSKEIHEQPGAVADTLLGRMHGPDSLLDESRGVSDELARAGKVFVVACGSSFHAGLVGKYAIERWARVPVEVDIASEFRYRDPVLDASMLVVGISQSGETADTLQAMRQARGMGAKVVVLSNVVDSSMAREADGVLYTRAGPEIGVAATKTHLAQVAALELLALEMARLRGSLQDVELQRLRQELDAVPRLLAETIGREPDVAPIAQRFAGADDVFFVGRHVGYPVAMEGALKLKEIAYVRAEAYPAGELKHGPIALVEPGTVVVALATRSALREKMLSNIAEVRSRGAAVVAVATDGDDEVASLVDEVLWVPPTEPLLAPLVDVIPLQLLAYHVACARGLDVDRPRNLAKTVTVE